MAGPDGNGEDRVRTAAEQIGPDHVVFHPGRAPDDPAELPFVLSRALVGWLADNADVRVRSTLGVVANGQTAAIHLWFDKVGQS